MAIKPEAAGRGVIRFFKAVFLVAALYDLVLGAVFFFLYRPLFDAFGIDLPNNTSYIHLTAGYVFVQGVGYWFVYRNMMRNVDLVKLGIVYKIIYSGVAVYYLAIGELLNAAFAWFAVFDGVFAVLFVAFLLRVRALQPHEHSQD